MKTISYILTLFLIWVPFLGNGQTKITATSDSEADAIFATSLHGRGVVGNSTTGIGIRGGSQQSFGIYGFSDGAHGALFSGKNSTGFADIVLSGEEGILMSNPEIDTSDLWLVANDDVIVELNQNSDSTIGNFIIMTGWGATAFEVTQSGRVFVNGTLVHSSDRNNKENIEDIDPNEILVKVASLPITKWNFKKEPFQHIGPMAQDFHQTFDLGTDEKGIATVDADGVALAAIQALYQEDKKNKRKMAEQQSDIAKLKEEITFLKEIVCLEKKN